MFMGCNSLLFYVIAAKHYTAEYFKVLHFSSDLFCAFLSLHLPLVQGYNCVTDVLKDF